MYDYDFIEIGTSDFDTLLEKSDDKKRGLSIDPLQYYLDRLPDKENCQKVCCAIYDKEGEEDIYYITQENIDKYNLPNFVRGTGCLGGHHPFIRVLLNNQSDTHPIGQVLDPEEIYSTKKVPVKRLKTIIDEYNVKSIKILKIDAEGSDSKIILDYMKCCRDEGYPKPIVIQVEHVLMYHKTKRKVIDLITSQGYRLMDSDIDNMIFFKNKYE